MPECVRPPCLVRLVDPVPPPGSALNGRATRSLADSIGSSKAVSILGSPRQDIAGVTNVVVVVGSRNLNEAQLRAGLASYRSAGPGLRRWVPLVSVPQEPEAGNPPVRICAGAAVRCALPRHPWIVRLLNDGRLVATFRPLVSRRASMLRYSRGVFSQDVVPELGGRVSLEAPGARKCQCRMTKCPPSHGMESARSTAGPRRMRSGGRSSRRDSCLSARQPITRQVPRLVVALFSARLLDGPWQASREQLGGAGA